VSRYVLLVSALVIGFSAGAELRAGVATASITPLEAKIPTQLGGYGARNGEPAHGIHDTINAKALILAWGDEKTAIVTLDTCSVPRCAVEESLQKAGIEGLTYERTLMPASHSHGGLEGFALDRRNIAGNPHIGLFSEEMLDFVTDRIAQALREAHGNLRPARAASGVVEASGMTANRRGDAFTDDDITVLRIDSMDGGPLAVLVDFTAHGTIMTEREMLISGGWAGNMQRTVETLMPGATCLYMNGAEGDIRPSGAQGGSRWEIAEDYGRRIGLQAAELATGLKPRKVKRFAMMGKMILLPERQSPPGFIEIAGDEYGVTQEQLDQLIQVMFPEAAPIYALRIDDYQTVSFPGEAICQLGLSVKAALRAEGVKHPCIAGLTSEHIGYILTKDEYHQGGYETTVSFYGDGLGAHLLAAATELGVATARAAE
jgi:neutral/alkaline ceramidase-like enzyme